MLRTKKYEMANTLGSIRKLRNALDGWGWVATLRYFALLCTLSLYFSRYGTGGVGGGQKFAFLALRNLRTLP